MQRAPAGAGNRYARETGKASEYFRLRICLESGQSACHGTDYFQSMTDEPRRPAGQKRGRRSAGAESAGRIGFLIDLPALSVPRPGVASVVLDRVQDAGNVGSILRSACAFGFGQVLALRGTAGLWSSKVLRAAMGAHFGLQLIEGLQPSDISALGLPLIVTSSHQGQWLQQQNLPWPCAWAFGHEGQGLCDELLGAAERGVRIAQPGGEESLNVAAAAAICLHASAIAQARERGPR